VPAELAASGGDTAASLTLIGTLGGVVITALFGLLTAYFSQRWQYRRTEQEHRLQADRDVRTARRDAYVRYIVAAQRVFDAATRLYRSNRTAPIDMAEFSRNLPADLVDAVVDAETRRVEAHLLAGERVAVALAEYTGWLRGFWPEAASGAGTSTLDTRDENAPYHRLIRAMQAEVSNALSPNPLD
jgi:hypothetical protein